MHLKNLKIGSLQKKINKIKSLKMVSSPPAFAKCFYLFIYLLPIKTVEKETVANSGFSVLK